MTPRLPLISSPLYGAPGLRRLRCAIPLVFGAALWLAAPAVQAMPLLSEVYYDAPGSDDGQLFVELHGRAGVSLDGLTLDGVNGSNGAIGPSITLEGAIGADGFFVVADRRSDGTTDVLAFDLLANFDFQNGPDSVVLRRGETILDALGYGVFGLNDLFAGEGAAAPDASAGQSVARRFANVDTDDNAADFVLLDAPTPGTAPLSAIPEPGTSTLLGLGLLGLARMRRASGAVPARGAASGVADR